MIPEFWLTEGGQSATGALLDYIIENHVAAPLLSNRAASQSMLCFMPSEECFLGFACNLEKQHNFCLICTGISIYELLNKMLLSMSHEQNSPFLSALTRDIHVLPDFHGNR
jgi:ribulose kinase